MKHLLFLNWVLFYGWANLVIAFCLFMGCHGTPALAVAFGVWGVSIAEIGYFFDKVLPEMKRRKTMKKRLIIPEGNGC